MYTLILILCLFSLCLHFTFSASSNLLFVLAFFSFLLNFCLKISLVNCIDLKPISRGWWVLKMRSGNPRVKSWCYTLIVDIVGSSDKISPSHQPHYTGLVWTIWKNKPQTHKVKRNLEKTHSEPASSSWPVFVKKPETLLFPKHQVAVLKHSCDVSIQTLPTTHT